MGKAIVRLENDLAIARERIAVLEAERAALERLIDAMRDQLEQLGGRVERIDPDGGRKDKPPQ